MEKWRGKIAVVTGGSSGIGKSIAENLFKHEITTIILDINEPSVILSEHLHFYRLDVSNLDSIKEAFKWIEDEFKFVHILINNAGIVRSTNLLDTSDDATEKIITCVNVNFLGAVHCAREALRIMQKSNDFGMIVNTCSVAGIVNIYPPIANIYGPTKHAIRSFSEVLRGELAFNENQKIRITNLCPGAVNTNIFSTPNVNHEQIKSVINNFLDPNDIAEGVMYVLSTPYTVNVSEICIRSLCEKM